MIKKLRLMTVVGTRPEVIKMSEIIKKADQYFDQILVHTGQNYDYTLNKRAEYSGAGLLFGCCW